MGNSSKRIILKASQSTDIFPTECIKTLNL